MSPGIIQDWFSERNFISPSLEENVIVSSSIVLLCACLNVLVIAGYCTKKRNRLEAVRVRVAFIDIFMTTSNLGLLNLDFYLIESGINNAIISTLNWVLRGFCVTAYFWLIVSIALLRWLIVSRPLKWTIIFNRLRLILILLATADSLCVLVSQIYDSKVLLLGKVVLSILKVGLIGFCCTSLFLRLRKLPRSNHVRISGKSSTRNHLRRRNALPHISHTPR